jgi:hypothetical protein
VPIVPRKRLTYRPRFELEIQGEGRSRVYMASPSEWWLFRDLREISKYGEQLQMLACNGHGLTPRSLAGLNVYLRTGAIRKWKSRRWDGNRELIGSGEWARFCRMLGLRFEGKGVRRVA